MNSAQAGAVGSLLHAAPAMVQGFEGGTACAFADVVVAEAAVHSEYHTSGNEVLINVTLFSTLTIVYLERSY